MENLILIFREYQTFKIWHLILDIPCKKKQTKITFFFFCKNTKKSQLKFSITLSQIYHWEYLTYKMHSSCHSSFLSWKLRKVYNCERLKTQRIVTFLYSNSNWNVELNKNFGNKDFFTKNICLQNFSWQWKNLYRHQWDNRCSLSIIQFSVWFW